MTREQCWLSFSQALEMYLTARQVMGSSPEGCSRWEDAKHDKELAAEMMDALTDSADFA